MELACARESWGGFPFRFEFQCETASLQFIHGNETYNIQSTKILAIAQAYNPLHVILLVDGPTSIDRTTVIHERALISVTVRPRQDWDASLEAAKRKCPGPVYGRPIETLRQKNKRQAGSRSRHRGAHGDPSRTIRPSPFQAPNSSAKPAPHSSRNSAWHGQALEISSLKISQGPVDFAATGTVSLDPQHRLAGKLSSQTNDIDGVMKFIEPIFALNEQDSATIKNLVTLTGSDPATKTTKADFTARDGALYWGLIKLADLTPLY